ncbi:ABC transporter ATP-binding protein [Pontibacillus salicampi]|uniref:ABC transporter ATP-binding protein n=1 Tax=Pontibacillus salicampi TaxID=1449801 RepID=A0ABV6LM23_9BACI
MIEFRKVVKKYKRNIVLTIPSLTLKPGAAYGVIGPNGAGKSTLLRLLASIERPSKGTIHYHGKPYKKVVKQVRKGIGYIPQEIALFEEFTVTQQIDFWKRISPATIDEAFVEEMVTTLKLHKVMHRRVSDLSGGWQRKVNLCVGMLHKPTICLLDEPTTGIDIAAKEDILYWLSTLHKQEGMTLVYISHDRHELTSLSDHFIVMHEGHILFCGETDMFFHQRSYLLEGQQSTYSSELGKILSYI